MTREAEDLIQETLCRLLDYARRAHVAARSIASIEALAMRILRNLQCDVHRTSRFVPLDSEPAVTFDVDEPKSEGCLSASQILKLKFKGRVQRAILRALAKGDSLQSTALRLSLPIKELNRVTNRMILTLREHISRNPTEPVPEGHQDQSC